jgi:hypothetical protein
MQSVPSCLRVKLGWCELKNPTFNSAGLTQFAFLAELRSLVSYASLLFASGIGRNLMFCVILEWCRTKSNWFDLRVNGRKLTTRASTIVRWNQQIHWAFCCFGSCTRTCWVFDSKRLSMQNAETFQQENQSWIVDLQPTIIETDSWRCHVDAIEASPIRCFRSKNDIMMSGDVRVLRIESFPGSALWGLHSRLSRDSCKLRTHGFNTVCGNWFAFHHL